MDDLQEVEPRKKTASWVRSFAAGISVFAVAGVAIGAPLVSSASLPQAQAEVVPLARGEVMNQQLMAQATEEFMQFELPQIEVEKVETTVKSGSADSSESSSSSNSNSATSAAPAAGTPDPGSAQAIALGYVGAGAEFDCLVALWNKESNWNYLAENASSGAYGIPQSLPGEKMASAGDDWRTNPDTQIRWGLGYISGRYGSPCAAWAHSQAVGWY